MKFTQLIKLLSSKNKEDWRIVMKTKEKDIILCCDGACEGHHLIFHQIDDTYENRPIGEDPEVYITVHLDTIPFKERLRWVFTGRNKSYGHFVSTITTKKKLQDIINQLE